MRLKCYQCGESVSSEVPEGTVLMAIAICPECCERAAEAIGVTKTVKKTISDNTWIVVPTTYGDTHKGYSIIDRRQQEHTKHWHSRKKAHEICDAHNAALNEFKKRTT